MTWVRTLHRAALLVAGAASLARAGAAPEPVAPPIIVILTDTLRADVLRTFEPRATGGVEIERLARDGITFAAARSNSSWTRTAVATLLTGLAEQRHRVFERGDVLDASFDTLAERLRRAGYRTAAWSTNPNILPLWGFDQGFEQFVDLGASTWGATTKADAHLALERALEFARAQRTEPWLAYIHLMDPHFPYQPEEGDLAGVRAEPSSARTLPGRDDASADAGAVEAFERYLAEVRGMDREIGRFLDALRRDGIYDRAIVLVVSDHGEEFLDHGGTDHGKTLYEEMLHVPAVLKLSGNAAAGSRCETAVGLADFLPTLLAAAGLPPAEGLDGATMWSGAAIVHPGPRPMLATLRLDQFDKRAALEQGWKLIRDAEEATELYDLGDDPGERHARDDSARAEVLARHIDAAESEGQEGWHLRWCGRGQGDIRFELTTSRPPRTAYFEPNDSARELDAARAGRVGAAATPAPGATRRYEVAFSSLKAERDTRALIATDEDEITLGDDGWIELRGKLRYALGDEEEIRSGRVLRLARHEEAPRVHRRVRCPRGARTSHLRIWYVAPADVVPDAALDPAVRERMRALGY